MSSSSSSTKSWAKGTIGSYMNAKTKVRRSQTGEYVIPDIFKSRTAFVKHLLGSIEAIQASLSILVCLMISWECSVHQQHSSSSSCQLYSMNTALIVFIAFNVVMTEIIRANKNISVNDRLQWVRVVVNAIINFWVGWLQGPRNNGSAWMLVYPAILGFNCYMPSISPLLFLTNLVTVTMCVPIGGYVAGKHWHYCFAEIIWSLVWAVGTGRVFFCFHSSWDIFVSLCDELQEVSKLKSEFLEACSHEIRTPLNGVAGMTQLLMTAAPEHCEYIDVISSCTNDLMVIINDILDYSKIQAGKISLENRVVDLREIVDNCVALFRETGNRKGVTIQSKQQQHSIISNTSQEFLVLIDTVRLGQILKNFISNALKFSRKGDTVNVIIRELSSIDDQQYSIKDNDPNFHDDNQGWENDSSFHSITSNQTTTTKSPSKKFILVEVQDSGPGIAPSQQERIWGWFSQADEKITRQYGGSGLGLAIAGKLSKIMNIRIGLKSPNELGGATFFMVIPQLLRKDGVSIGSNSQHSSDGTSSNSNSAESSHSQHSSRSTGGNCCIDSRCPGSATSSSQLSSRKLLQRARSSSITEAELQVSRSNNQLSSTRTSEKQQRFHKIKPAKKKKAAIEAPAPPHQFNLPLSVLVVDDVPINAKVCTKLLRTMNVESEVATNGLEALQNIVAGKEYFCILMDMQMPIMDGRESAERIQKHLQSHSLPPIPIISCTADAFVVKKQQQQQQEQQWDANTGDNDDQLQNFVDVIYKPLKRDNLIRVIMKIQDQHTKQKTQ